MQMLSKIYELLLERKYDSFILSKYMNDGKHGKFCKCIKSYPKSANRDFVHDLFPLLPSLQIVLAPEALINMEDNIYTYWWNMDQFVDIVFEKKGHD